MNLVLGVSGSVAAYRACHIARELMRRGFTVRVCLTDSASKFVTPALFEALTGQPCLEDAFEEPERGRMAHIDWARAADLLVIAPATANTIAKIAGGTADDMLSTIALAYSGPIVVAPAMNPTMFAAEPIRAALETLTARGIEIVEPSEGEVACGEQGQGKLASATQIVETAMLVAKRSEMLRGKNVLITSGRTEEPIDMVRFISNRSSGKMGAALARAALLLGASVTVIAGPSSAVYPLDATIERVNTANEMLEAARGPASSADLIFGVAAVADFRVAEQEAGKTRRADGPICLQLEPNPDIIAELAKAAKPGAKVVGFAAEPSADLDVARQKIVSKRLHAIAVNDVSRGDIGFGSDLNELTLLTAEGTEASSGRTSKLGCALWLLEQLHTP